MNPPQHQQYPFAYGPIPVFPQAQQNMQRIPQQCGNMNSIYPFQQPVHPLPPQQYNPYLMQCSYLLPPTFYGHGQRSIYQYPQQQFRPPALSFFNQPQFAPPPHGLVQQPLPIPQINPQPQQMRPMPVQAQQLNSYCQAQLQNAYRAHATFARPPVMPSPPQNLNFLPNSMNGTPCSNSTAFPGDEEHRKHVYLRGALYNTNLLKPPHQQDDLPPFRDSKLQFNVTDDEPYNPMEEVSSSRVKWLYCILQIPSLFSFPPSLFLERLYLPSMAFASTIQTLDPKGPYLRNQMFARRLNPQRTTWYRLRSHQIRLRIAYRSFVAFIRCGRCIAWPMLRTMATSPLA